MGAGRRVQTGAGLAPRRAVPDLPSRLATRLTWASASHRHGFRAALRDKLT